MLDRTEAHVLAPPIADLLQLNQLEGRQLVRALQAGDYPPVERVAGAALERASDLTAAAVALLRQAGRTESQIDDFLMGDRVG